MGKRGPKPLPKNVLALRGGTKYLQKRGHDDGLVKLDIEIPHCPRHLLKEARKEWKRIAPELEALGLISRIDRAALALYCQEYAWWVWHDEALQRDINAMAEKQVTFEADEANGGKEFPGRNGFMLPTVNGNWQYNPHWVARNKHATQLDRFLGSFGMSPSARGRVTPSTRQLPLPGVDDPSKGGFKDL
jgi:P27 family predicted phage terminase small subunit